MKTPRAFANLYLQGKIIKPSFAFHYSSLSADLLAAKTEDKEVIKKLLLKLVKDTNLTMIKLLKLPTIINVKLCIALNELTLATILARQHLKKRTKEVVSRKKSTTKSLESALTYLGLSKSFKDSLRNEVERLKTDEEKGTVYHPIKELDFVETLFLNQAFAKRLSEIEKERRIPPDMEKMHIEEIYRETINKLNKMLNQPLSTKEGRPSKFFFKVLQIVIFEILQKEGNIAVGKAKTLSANIINEFFKKDTVHLMLIGNSKIETIALTISKVKNFKIETITSKDIDNALHSS